MSERGKVWLAITFGSILFWSALVVGVRHAMAQEQSPPMVQSLYARYAKEVNLGIACEAEVIGLRARVTELEKAAEAAKTKDDSGKSEFGKPVDSGGVIPK